MDDAIYRKFILSLKVACPNIISQSKLRKTLPRYLHSGKMDPWVFDIIIPVFWHVPSVVRMTFELWWILSGNTVFIINNVIRQNVQRDPFSIIS